MSNQDIIIQDIHPGADMHYVACVKCSSLMFVCTDKKSGKFFGLCQKCKLYCPLLDSAGKPSSNIIMIQ